MIPPDELRSFHSLYFQVAPEDILRAYEKYDDADIVDWENLGTYRLYVRSAAEFDSLSKDTKSILWDYECGFPPTIAEKGAS